MDEPEADAESVAREIALRLLSVRPRTRAELAQAFVKRNVPPDVAESVLERFTEVGLIDDTEFAAAWSTSRLTNRHLSKAAVRRELMAKGVERDVIDDTLAQVSSDDEYATASALARRKVRSLGGLERDVAYRRLAGMLARRGFGAGIVHQVLRDVLDTEVDESFD